MPSLTAAEEPPSLPDAMRALADVFEKYPALDYSVMSIFPDHCGMSAAEQVGLALDLAAIANGQPVGAGADGSDRVFIKADFGPLEVTSHTTTHAGRQAAVPNQFPSHPTLGSAEWHRQVDAKADRRAAEQVA